MSNYEIAELTWENGQLGMNEVIQTRPAAIWDGRTSSETLESIVNQAALQNNSGEKWAVTPTGDAAARKRTRSESNCGSLGVKGSNCMELEISGRESESNTNYTMSWANSFDSSPSSNGKTAFDDFTSGAGGSEKREGDGETKTETTRCGSSRRSRAAAVHNQSERRRRDRINQKMKTLQKLVPNASKTDKASMLDEVLQYIKQLQAQVQVMSNCNNARMNIPNMNMNMPNMNMPSMNMMMQQYQLQLSLLSRMGNNTTPFLPPPFLLPSSSLIQPPPPSQSMNMEMYNKMAELYLQQVNQGTPGTSHQ